MWPGWKAKFLTSNAASLRPERAQRILDDFLTHHPEHMDGACAVGAAHASQKGTVASDREQEHQ